VAVQSSQDIYRLIGSESKQYHEIDFDLHGIVRGDISTLVFAHVGDFLHGFNGDDAEGFRLAN